jgi:hypothetical protein
MVRVAGFAVAALDAKKRAGFDEKLSDEPGLARLRQSLRRKR